jgi:hypothetical protein
MRINFNMKTITQVKKYGSSFVLRLDKEFREWLGLDVGDWVDISEINKVKRKNDKSKI